MTKAEKEPKQMPLTNNNFLLMIAGPTASGKDAVISRLHASYPGVVKIVTYSTRARRLQESEGVDYNFLTTTAFMARKDDFVFNTVRQMGQDTVHYGMAREDLLAVADGGSHICNLDLTSFARIPEEVNRAARGDQLLAKACLRLIYPVYLGVPRLTLLRERYLTRHREDDEKSGFLSRLKQDWMTWKNYKESIPSMVMNDNVLGITVNQIVSLINQFVE